MVLRLHGEALLKKARPGAQVDERVVHLLAAGYVRDTIADLDRLMNYIATAFPTFRLGLALAGIAPGSLRCCRDVQSKTIRAICCIRSQCESMTFLFI